MSDLIRSARFRAEREAAWRELEGLIARIEAKGPGALRFEEAERTAALYRQTVSALSLARDISLDANLLAYLEALAARAYLAVYAPQASVRGLFWRLMSRGIPRAMRRSWLALLLSFLALALGTAVGWLLFLTDPSWFDTFVPPGLAGGRGPDATTEDLRAVIYDTDGHDGDRLTRFAAFLFSNNTGVAIFAFGLGAFGCWAGLVLVFWNALILGAFLGLHFDRGLGYDMVAWLSVHGVTELAAIVIAAAAGQVLGLALLFPGPARRADALRAASPDAVRLVLLAALMLVAAAILEGFFRQLVQDPNVRMAIGWGAGALWLTWWLGAGR